MRTDIAAIVAEPEQKLLAGEGQLSGILALGVSTLHPNKRN